MNKNYTFRPIEKTDLPFLSRLYASTRAEEMNRVPWSEQEKLEFLQGQFHAQHTFYMENFPNSSFDLILVNENEAGRLYLDEREDEFRIIDISLLPEFRGTGIGTTILKDIQSQANSVAKKVRIHVEKNNPAMSLYRRLQFVDVEDQGVYLLMEWNSTDR